MRPRIQQVARCCGSLYRRWPDAPGSSPHLVCVHCGSPLEYLRANRRANKRAAGLTSWQRKVAARYAAGLTSRGTVRKYRRHQFGNVHKSTRTRVRVQAYAAEQRAAKALAKLTPQERAWREFRASTTIPQEAAA